MRLHLGIMCSVTWFEFVMQEIVCTLFTLFARYNISTSWQLMFHFEDERIDSTYGLQSSKLMKFFKKKELIQLHLDNYIQSLE